MILGLFVLLLVAGVVIAFPLVRYGSSSAVTSVSAKTEVGGAKAVLEENVRIFRKNEADLASQLAGAQITKEQHAQLLVELQRNLIADQQSLGVGQTSAAFNVGPKLVAGFVCLVFAAGTAYYLKKGAMTDVSVYALQQQKMELDYKDMLENKPSAPERAQALANAYQERVTAKPESVQYWFLLARTRMELGQYAEAVAAYRELLKRDQDSPMVFAETAQAIFLRDGNQAGEEVVKLAKSALTLEPENSMALGLLGIAAYNAKDYKTCIRYWQKAVDSLGSNSQGAQALAAGIEKAKSAHVAAGGKLEDLTAKSIYTLTLEVRLGPNAKVKPDQTVFVYARAFQGMPMPLAIQRFKVSELPKLVQLDESMAMSPAASLAASDRVEVLARVSETGTAQARAGDWIANQGPIDMKSIPEKIVLEINDQYRGN